MIRRLLFLLSVILLASLAEAQKTHVTAFVRDSNGAVYVNCSWSTTFVGQNTTPGAGPYAPDAYIQPQQGHCDSAGNFSVDLGDNVNTITPTPSQWQFNICSAPGYVPGGTFCSSAILITIQGISQDISSVVVPILPLLPVTGGATHFQVNSTPLVGTPTTINFVASTNMTIVDSGAGSITFSASGGGGGGSPGGTNQQNQFNNSSSFGGEFNSTFNTTTGETNTANLNKVRSPSPLAGTTYNWLQSPADNLSSPGSGKTINLSCGDGGTGHSNPCIGIDTSNTATKPFSVYISTVGTPEAVPVTGGTCSLFSTANCTIIVTTANVHTAGYTVGSAYGGIQEAINDAASPDAKIVLQPVGANVNAYKVYAPIFFQNNRSVLEGDGTFVQCFTRGMCLVLGDLVNSNNFLDIRIHSIRMASSVNIAGVAITNAERAGCPGSGTCQVNITTAAHPFIVGDYVDIQMTNDTTYWGIWKVTAVPDTTHFSALYSASVNTPAPNSNIASAASLGQVALANAAIFDNAGGSVMSEVQFESGNAVTPIGRFHNGMVVFNDQSAAIDNPALTSGTAFRCDSTYCSNVIYGPGPFSPNAAVITVKGRQLSIGCGANGITNYGGNTLGVSDLVIQAFGQWAINNTALRGGFGDGTYTNIYNELGTCTNPDYPGTSVGAKQSAAGLIGGGTVRGGEFPIGQRPVYDCVGSAGANALYYWIIIKDSVDGTSAPLLAGNTLASCSGNVTVQWPRVPGANTVTYDIVRSGLVSGTLLAPFIGNCGGGSITACGSVNTAQAQCSARTCSFTDNSAANTTSYTIVQPTYFPRLYFWPGGAVEASVTDTVAVANVPKLYFDASPFLTPLSTLITETAWLVPTFFAHECTGLTPGVWVSCLAENSVGNSSVGATLLQPGISGGGTTTGLKGRLNFPWQTVVNGEVITLADTNPSATIADGTHRPLGSATDTFVGFDNTAAVVPSAAQLAFGSPISISNYIANKGDGSNWLERLTSTKKTFSVPVVSTSQLVALGSGCFGCGPFQPSGTQVSGFGTGSNFTAITGSFSFASQQATWTANGAPSFASTSYTASTFAAAQFAQTKVISFSPGSPGICTDMTNTPGNMTSYCIVSVGGVGKLDKINAAGTVTVLATGFPNFANGDTITLYSVPNAGLTSTTLTYYQNGSLINSTTDSSSPIVSGFPGILCQNSPCVLGLFTAGDLAYSTTSAITVQNATCAGTCTGFAGGGTVTHTGNLNATTVIAGNGVADITMPSATTTLDTSGNFSTGGSYVSTAANGGIFGTEGTGNCTPGAGTDCMYWDSTLHGVHLNTNNVDQGVAIGTRSFQAVYNHSGTQITTPHLIEDRCTLGTDCSVTLTGSAVYTSSSTYDCFGSDRTGANAIKFVPSSGSAFALTGTGTDLISYWCIGN